MTADQIQQGMLAVQFLALLGLIVYVIYTGKLANSARDQITLSQKLLKAAMDQAEGVAKPCLILFSSLRDREDTLMELGGAKGALVATGNNEGNFLIHNVGNAGTKRATTVISRRWHRARRCDCHSRWQWRSFVGR
jgi:hypothetical protein